MTAIPDSNSPIFVTGGTGQVGRELVRLLGKSAKVLAPSRSELDLSDLSAVRSYIRAAKPSVILNAAAYTAVDRAEDDANACRTLNAKLPALLASEAASMGVLFVHYSTDYVFDGRKDSPYTESDGTNPLNVYGETKLEAEQAVLASGAQAIVFRCSWVYSLHGKNFLRTMLRLRGEKSEMKIVADQRGAPTWATAIARATVDVVRADENQGKTGLYHLSARGHTSWKDFAEEIFRVEAGPNPRVVGITTAEYGAPAQRPLNSVLSNSRLEATFGVRMSTWQDQLRDCLAGS